MPVTLDLDGQRCDIQTREGAEVSIPLEFYTAAGAAIDTSGRTFQAEMKTGPDKDAAAVLTFTITPGATGLDPLTITASFDGVAPGHYWWDLWQQIGAEDIPLAFGRVTVSRRVTTNP